MTWLCTTLMKILARTWEQHLVLALWPGELSCAWGIRAVARQDAQPRSRPCAAETVKASSGIDMFVTACVCVCVWL